RIAAVVFNLFHPSARVKIVHTFHGHVLSGYFNPITTAVFTAIERTLAFFTHSIITVSGSVRDDLVRLKIARREKIRVIPLGFELDAFLSAGPRPQPSGFVVGIVGRLVPIKNHRMFLDAAALVHRKIAGIRFLVVGDGEERGNLEAYARDAAIDCVDFSGWSNDLKQVYSGLDLVVLTSINEGTPVSVIEAMACGRPVIATDVGGVRDLFGPVQKEISLPEGMFRLCERGILVPSNDSRSLAAAIAFMYENAAARREMGTAGRAYVREAFSKQRLVRDIEDLYEKLHGNDII
ncbi:MAG TPA: glycosyltransferase, partial [Candidatus Omnitrophota bacterium]|nr:glycosyltransferase [Candidatus Omnitrophota bacterium]